MSIKKFTRWEKKCAIVGSPSSISLRKLQRGSLRILQSFAKPQVLDQSLMCVGTPSRFSPLVSA